jgi:hypothetical protein
MAGKAKAVESGTALVDAVAELAARIGLEVSREVRVGRRLWGAVRRIDLVLTHPDARTRLGIECKFQGSQGSAEEKIPTTIKDIAAWPIRGIVVFAGEGLSANMRGFLLSSGLAVEYVDLEDWLRLYFGLELAGGA